MASVNIPPPDIDDDDADFQPTHTHVPSHTHAPSHGSRMPSRTDSAAAPGAEDGLNPADVSRINVGGTGRTDALCGCSIRACVSRQKRRFVDRGVDLDLTYISDRVIAMGYPSTGFEACYRNPADDVRRFLDSRHEGHYRIWNLCSEREYRSGFVCEVERFTWADHTPPPAALMLPACESMDAWLNSDPANVAVVHCKAGKGRTGTLIAAYLAHTHVTATADDAIRMFGERRTMNGKGITIPSQQRFVRYYGFQLAALRAWPGVGHRGPGARRTVHSVVRSPQARPPTGSGLTIRSPVTRKVVNSTGSAPSSVAATPADGVAAAQTTAEGVLVRIDWGAHVRGPGVKGNVFTVRIMRDSDRSPGFSIRANDAGRPVIDHVDSAARPASRTSEPATNTSRAEEVMPIIAAAHDAAARGSSGNRVLAGLSSSGPVPVRELLHTGDELLSINDVDLTVRSFPEAVSLLRSATDPLTIRLGRDADRGIERERSTLITTGPSAGSRGSDAPEFDAAEYVRRIARAIGPWAAGSDPRVVPVPTVRLARAVFSHAPAAAQGGMSCASSSTALASAADLTILVYGGPGCTTMLYCSAPAHAGGKTDVAGAVEVELVGAGGAARADDVDKEALASAASGHTRSSTGLELPIAAPVSLRGDFRLIVMQTGRRKPLISTWMHTAFLPCPALVLDTAAAAASTEADPSPTTPVEAPSSAALGSPPAAGAAKDTGISPSSRAGFRRLMEDVPGGKVQRGMPLLGAIHSAAGHASAPVAAATPLHRGRITLKKLQLDSLNKDKHGVIVPADFTLTLEYTLADAPSAFEAAFATGRTPDIASVHPAPLQ